MQHRVASLMGKGGKGSGNRVARAPADDDEALLNAAIAENKAAQAKAEQEKAEQEKLMAETAAAAPPGKALTKQQIIEALNAVPTFCLLNGEANIVGLQDPENPKYEVCFWMTDAAEAKEMLTAAKANNSEEVAGKLHLGVTPLGVAFGLASGWIETCWSWLKVPPGLPQRTAHQLVWWLRWHRALPHHAERRIMRPPQHCLRLRRAPPSSTQVVLRRHAATGRAGGHGRPDPDAAAAGGGAGARAGELAGARLLLRRAAAAGGDDARCGRRGPPPPSSPRHAF